MDLLQGTPGGWNSASGRFPLNTCRDGDRKANVQSGGGRGERCDGNPTGESGSQAGRNREKPSPGWLRSEPPAPADPAASAGTGTPRCKPGLRLKEPRSALLSSAQLSKDVLIGN